MPFERGRGAPPACETDGWVTRRLFLTAV